MNYSSAGSGTTQHLSGELFKLRTGTTSCTCPYKGSAPSLTALLGGRSRDDVREHPGDLVAREIGRLRALAIDRHQALRPVAGRADDEGIGHQRRRSGRSGTACSRRRNAARHREHPRRRYPESRALPRDAEALLDQGAEPVGNTPEEFSKLLREEVITEWRPRPGKRPAGPAGRLTGMTAVHATTRCRRRWRWEVAACSDDWFGPQRRRCRASERLSRLTAGH